MKYYFLIILFLMSFAGSVLGSEKNDGVIILRVPVRLIDNPLLYCNKKYVDFLNTTYDMQCKYNEPFISMKYSGYPYDLLKKISVWCLPLRYFVEDNNSSQNGYSLKKPGSILFSGSIKSTQNKFQICLGSCCDKMGYQFLLNQFKVKPRFIIIGPDCELLSYQHEYADAVDQLCQAGKIRKVGNNYGYRDHRQQYKHGINGYFAENIETKNKKIEKKAIKEQQDVVKIEPKKLEELTEIKQEEIQLASPLTNDNPQVLQDQQEKIKKIKAQQETIRLVYLRFWREKYGYNDGISLLKTLC